MSSPALARRSPAASESNLAAHAKTLSPRNIRSGHLPALTGLRFFLALWVLFGHLLGKGNAYEPLALMMPGPLQPITRNGYLAVPAFFVLSGFVLARTYGSTLWSPRSVWKYLAGRVARVYPVYLLSLLIVLPFIIKAKDQPKGWLVAMHVSLTQGWFAGHFTAGWNTPAWSLSCEMFFYLMFPLLIVLMRNWGWRQIIPAAALTCVLPQAMVAAGISDLIKPLFHLPDFIMGIAVSRAFDLLSARPQPPSGKWLYGTGLLGSAAFIGYAQYLPKWLPLATLLRPLNAALLLGLGLGGGLVARFLSTRPLVYLGKASYSMYILHVPILWWAVSWSAFAVRTFYAAAVIAVSCLVYSLFEEPANRGLRALLGDRLLNRHSRAGAPAVPAA
jgi:peptidoglycan/LPS O-acetylase OafA/YrhL